MNGFCPEGGRIGNSENQNAMSTVTALSEAAAKEMILESVAYLCNSRHDLMVDLGCMRGVIPHEEGAIGISDGRTKDIALISRVGKPVSFMVTDIKTDHLGKFYAVLSRRRAQETCAKKYISRLMPGDVINAKITHLENFGAFCDIGCGIIALLPIDSISVSRISHPRDRFSPGEDIRAVVKQITPEGRVTLTHKELLGTWEENAALFTQGETVSGVIRSVEDYGVFVELTPNLAGLAEPKNNVYIGQTASVYVKSIVPEKMKVKLIIIDSFDGKYSQNKTYFFTGDHMDSWQYSPESSDKQMLTNFIENTDKCGTI